MHDWYLAEVVEAALDEEGRHHEHRAHQRHRPRRRLLQRLLHLTRRHPPDQSINLRCDYICFSSPQAPADVELPSPQYFYYCSTWQLMNHCGVCSWIRHGWAGRQQLDPGDWIGAFFFICTRPADTYSSFFKQVEIHCLLIVPSCNQKISEKRNDNVIYRIALG
jgi:hypothetical protein